MGIIAIRKLAELTSCPDYSVSVLILANRNGVNTLTWNIIVQTNSTEFYVYAVSTHR